MPLKLFVAKWLKHAGADGGFSCKGERRFESYQRVYFI